MATEPTPSPESVAPSSAAETVPEELLRKLHDANQRFSIARRHREEAMDEPTPEDAGREQAAQQMREAERKVEEITDEIDRDLGHG
jgi:hypothetical protein